MVSSWLRNRLEGVCYDPRRRFLGATVTTEQAARLILQPNDPDKEAELQLFELPLVMRLRPVVNLTEDQFFRLCQVNHDLRIERNAQGELLIMPPAGWETSGRNAQITAQLTTWANRDGTGVATDSSGGFTLPSGAVMAPDAAWVRRSRLEGIPRRRRERFIPICPNFAIELRSPSDTLRAVRAKMEQYLANGAELAWLIDPKPRHVYVYRSGAAVERLENPATVAGDPLLPGFVLDLSAIW